MRARVLAVMLCVILVGSCAASSDDASNPAQHADAVSTDPGPDEHLTYRPGAIQWQDGPSSLPAGTQFAVLEGDPSEASFFTMRVKFPDGQLVLPHTHPAVERVTVVSGVFYLGLGDTFDRSAAERLEPGTYTSLPPNMVHYAFAQGETVIQLTSIGPWGLEYVNPEDDPRNNA